MTEPLICCSRGLLGTHTVVLVESERVGDSIGNNKVRMPGDKEMNQNVGGNNRIGGPRGLYDSETRGDGKHWCQWLLFLASRKQGATRFSICWMASTVNFKFSSIGFGSPFRHFSVNRS
jgi:hypothetical protein